MKYTINYLYLPYGSARPVDNEEVVDIEADDGRFLLMPDIGDHVRLLREDGSSSLEGRVRSRLFTYAGGYCHVDVVLEETSESIESLTAE